MATTNIDKYLGNLTGGQDCMIFKTWDFDTATDSEVIYIGDYGIQDLTEYKERGQDLTDGEMIAKGIASSKASIRQELIDYGDYTEEEIDQRNIVEIVFEFLDWASSSTVVSEVGDWLD